MPLIDDSFGIAQAIDAMMVNVIYVALFDVRTESLPAAAPQLDRRRVVALAATWRQQLNGGEWPRLSTAAPAVGKEDFPNECFADAGYVGAKHYDAGILADFLSAYHGLLPWNVMFDEAYYDGLLAPGVPRPSTAVILAPGERAAYRAAHP